MKNNSLLGYSYGFRAIILPTFRVQVSSVCLADRIQGMKRGLQNVFSPRWGVAGVSPRSRADVGSKKRSFETYPSSSMPQQKLGYAYSQIQV